MKIIEVDKLNAFIQANQKDEAVVIPPIDPPVDPPVDPPPPPPSTGAFKDAVEHAYKLNTPIKTRDGSPTSFGMGFKDQCVPGPVSCRAGKTYFLLNTDWRPTFVSRQLRWINMGISGESQHTSLIRLDAENNGVVIGNSDGKQDFFKITTAGRYLIEVATGTGISLSIHW